MTETRDLLEEIYQGLDRAEAPVELEPRDKGGYYLLICPNCRKREAYIYKGGTRIICSRRDKCGFSQSVWDYAQGSRRLTNQETLRELARLAEAPSYRRDIFTYAPRSYGAEDYLNLCKEILQRGGRK